MLASRKRVKSIRVKVISPAMVPRALVALEIIFDRQDRKKSNVEQMKPGDYIEVNIGTDQNPKLIKIGKGTSQNERNELINLVKEYRVLFAFTYDELKSISGRRIPAYYTTQTRT